MALQKTIAQPGRGIMAMDESNATCGLRLASIGMENTEANRQAYRQLLVSTPGLGQYISGAILFEETLYQNTTDDKKMVDILQENGIIPGIKVDKVSVLESEAMWLKRADMKFTVACVIVGRDLTKCVVDVVRVLCH
jgi:fructose-bisphosphate aldolase class 1